MFGLVLVRLISVVFVIIFLSFFSCVFPGLHVLRRDDIIYFIVAGLFLGTELNKTKEAKY